MKQAGFLAIDKPLNLTSFNIVARVRKLLDIKKVGHAGTLDPLASGVLIIAFGAATRAIDYVTNQVKQYEFTVKFGAATDSGDLEGEIIKESDIIPTKEATEKILSCFTGKIKQTPPIFSAVKINGTRAYKMARKGREFEMPAREIEIFSLKLIDFDATNKTAKFDCICSKGTYIRSLGRDIAEKINSCGHLVYLRRKKIGNIDEKRIITLEKLEELVHNNELDKFIININDMLDDIPVINIDEQTAKKVTSGQKIALNSTVTGLVRLVTNEKLIAIVTLDNGLIFNFNHVFNN